MAHSFFKYETLCAAISLGNVAQLNKMLESPRFDRLDATLDEKLLIWSLSKHQLPCAALIMKKQKPHINQCTVFFSLLGENLRRSQDVEIDWNDLAADVLQMLRSSALPSLFQFVICSRNLNFFKAVIGHLPDDKQSCVQNVFAATRIGAIDFVRHLVENCNVDPCSVDPKSDDDDCILHLAVQVRHAGLVNYLLQVGAAVDQLTYWDKTALELAVRQRDLQIVDILLEHGADMFHVNDDGDSVWQLAQRWFPDVAAHIKRTQPRIEFNCLVRLCLLMKPLDLPVFVIFEIYLHSACPASMTVGRYAGWQLAKNIKDINQKSKFDRSKSGMRD